MALHKTKESLEDLLKEPEKHIPPGIYCYGADGECPFWDWDDKRDPQGNGYCHYLDADDLELCAEGDHISLLWDQCKECGINDIDEEFW